VLLLTAVIRLAGRDPFAVATSVATCGEAVPLGAARSGFGLADSTPLVLTSFYAYYQNRLGAILPHGYTASALARLGGALVLIALLVGRKPQRRVRRRAPRRGAPC